MNILKDETDIEEAIRGRVFSKRAIDAYLEYMKSAATVRRGVYSASEDATRKYEKSRESISKAFKVTKDNIIFVGNIKEISRWNFTIVKGPFTSKEDIVEQMKQNSSDKILDCSTFLHNLSSIDVSSYNIYFDGFFIGLPGISVICLKDVENMEPFEFGGDMIKRVTKDGAEYDDPPHKFSAGTPDIAGVIGIGEAVSDFDFNNDEVGKVFEKVCKVLKEKNIDFKEYKTSACFDILNSKERIYIPRQEPETIYIYLGK